MTNVLVYSNLNKKTGTLLEEMLKKISGILLQMMLWEPMIFMVIVILIQLVNQEEMLFDCNYSWYAQDFQVNKEVK